MIPPVSEVSVGRLSQLVQDHAGARVSEALTMLESAVRLQVEVKQFESKHNEAMQHGCRHGFTEGIKLVHSHFVEPVMDQITVLSIKVMSEAEKWEQLVTFIRSQSDRLQKEIEDTM